MTHPVEPALPAQRPRILLVEDEPTITVTLGDDLEDQGFVVTHTGNGIEAMRLCAEREFDAVITDLRLPGADGMQVLRAAKRQQPGTRVLVITAHVADLGEAVLRAGAGGILRKPFDNRRVIEWLRAECA